MVKAFKEHISASFAFLKNKKLLIACSGGLDSIVLSTLLNNLSYDIALAHCNFSLRGKESDDDSIFVREVAKKMDIPFYTKKFNTKAYASSKHISIQMAARTLRYAWFDTVAKEGAFDYVLTAHHADDDLETFFINLSRGTGLRGLAGIPRISDKIVRPLLFFSRDEILEYAKKNELFWREDSSNLSDHYLRNYLRHHVIPKYKEANTSALANFQTTQKYLLESTQLIDDYLQLVIALITVDQDDALFAIDVNKLKELPHLPALLYELFAPYHFTDFRALEQLITAQSGKQLFSKTHRLLKDRTLLLLTERTPDLYEDNILISEDTEQIDTPIAFQISVANDYKITNANTVFVDGDQLEYPLVLRKWKEGDYFQPLGMQGKKKLSKFFKDEKLSLIGKETTWVLCNQEEIIWVVGHRLDDRYKVTRDTKKIIRLDYTPKS